MSSVTTLYSIVDEIQITARIIILKKMGKNEQRITIIMKERKYKLCGMIYL